MLFMAHNLHKVLSKWLKGKKAKSLWSRCKRLKSAKVKNWVGFLLLMLNKDFSLGIKMALLLPGGYQKLASDQHKVAMV